VPRLSQHLWIRPKMDTEGLVACPDCAGSGQREPLVVIKRILMGGRPDYEIRNGCRFCGNVGVVPEAKAMWYTAGRALRAARVDRDESLAACAKRIRMNIAVLEDAERGLTDPARALPCAAE
jgi:hypothetical protein